MVTTPTIPLYVVRCTHRPQYQTIVEDDKLVQESCQVLKRIMTFHDIKATPEPTQRSSTSSLDGGGSGLGGMASGTRDRGRSVSGTGPSPSSSTLLSNLIGPGAKQREKRRLHDLQVFIPPANF